MNNNNIDNIPAVTGNAATILAYLYGTQSKDTLIRNYYEYPHKLYGQLAYIMYLYLIPSYKKVS